MFLEKLEKYIFYLFLFSIPFQMRKILYFPGWRFNEWQSVSLYLTDILILALFILWAFYYSSRFKIQDLRITNYGGRLRSLVQNQDFYLILFLIISAISIKNSSALYLSFYSWVKLLEFVLFYFYLKNYAFRRFDWIQSAWAIIAGGVFQAVIAISQFIKQSNLGLWFLDESYVNVDLRGTAYFLNDVGEKIVRAYGTTPHPNVLAGYFLLVLCIWYFINSKSITNYGLRITSYFLYSLILFAFFLTFSRAVILAWAVAFVAGILIYRRQYPAEIKKIFIITLMVASLFAALYWPEILGRLTIPADDESVALRKYYTGESLSSGLNLLGAGTGNFINWFVERNPYIAHWLYQPVHNIYLLIYAETGLLGISSFLLFLLFLVKNSISKISKSKFVICHLSFVICLLFIGLFDHFLWTLQQGRIVFWLALAGLTLYINKDRPPITTSLNNSRN